MGCLYFAQKPEKFEKDASYDMGCLFVVTTVFSHQNFAQYVVFYERNFSANYSNKFRPGSVNWC